MHLQTLKTTLSEGGGEGKHFCDADCISITGKEEICIRFWFVSTSFVRGCRFCKQLLNLPINLKLRSVRFACHFALNAREYIFMKLSG